MARNIIFFPLPFFSSFSNFYTQGANFLPSLVEINSLLSDNRTIKDAEE